MILHSHFDVAHLLGHSAFEHLAEAIKVYGHAKCNGLFNPASHLWPECLSHGLSLQMLRKAELEHCVQTVILFQAMMEKVPYFVPSIGSGLAPASQYAFANTWVDLLLQIKDPTTQVAARAAFDNYNNEFYKAFRNPIVHGKEAGDIEKIKLIRVPGVYAGMCSGWRAYDYLLTEVFAPQQTHEPSWAVMCAAHEIPDVLNLNDYPDLVGLEMQFNNKHCDGFRGVAGNE